MRAGRVCFGPGVTSAERPVATLARARNLIRASRSSGALESGAAMLPADAFVPVTDETILARLDPAVRGRARVCDLAPFVPDPFPNLKTGFRGALSAPWLYVDGEPMTLARWPNAGAPEGE